MSGPQMGRIRKDASAAHQFWLELIRKDVRLSNLSCEAISEKAKCCHGAKVFVNKGKVSEFLRAKPKRHPRWKYLFAVQQTLALPSVPRESLAQFWVNGARSDHRNDRWIADNFREIRLWTPETPSDFEQTFLAKYPARQARAAAVAGGLGSLLLVTSLLGYGFHPAAGDLHPRTTRYIEPEASGSTLGLRKVTLHRDLAVQLPQTSGTTYIARGQTIYLGCFGPDNTFAIAGTNARVTWPALEQAKVGNWDFTSCQGPTAAPLHPEPATDTK
ncbi:hypothetical protein JCM4814A_79340 [Streptomyces phaeofaciens JCM 4814]|uniref:Uncharacterized protein n=1 Tax=Streptomyces phaeofaciens TaxID=68254 RepID=A0A918HPW8_9ACTN|nr:hypothetical protein [Streptomyces phaeofaciens]GGT92689.1 hypothetical protein GCM10010226_83300 [Streptomyces phaeofaciens]